MKNKVVIAVYFLLLLGVTTSALSKPPHLTVSQVAGYYATSDKGVLCRTLSISFLSITSKYQPEQGNFTGFYGSYPLVGQGILSGGTDDGRLPDNEITFYFMFIVPQDSTGMLQCISIIRGGKVVGLSLYDADAATLSKNVKARYHRVSRAEFIRLQKIPE